MKICFVLEFIVKLLWVLIREKVIFLVFKELFSWRSRWLIVVSGSLFLRIKNLKVLLVNIVWYCIEFFILIVIVMEVLRGGVFMLVVEIEIVDVLFVLLSFLFTKSVLWGEILNSFFLLFFELIV